MSRIWLIIKREYITRVRKASFIIVTLLAPLGMVLLFGAQIFFISYSGDTKAVVVKDDSSLNWQNLESDNNIKYTYSNQPLDSLKNNYEKNGYEGVLYMPPIDLQNPEGIIYHSDKLLSITAKSKMESQLNSAIKDIKYKRVGIDDAKLE